MFPDFLDEPANEVARKLLGCELVRTIGNTTTRVRIVETESYDGTDAASHSFKGKTARSEVMFGASGFLYVYFTYGMHYCCNVVCGPEGEGAAVLIRAVEPIVNKKVLEQYRGKIGVELLNGPAKLCQALRIEKSLNGHDLRTSPLLLETAALYDDETIVTTTRVGISKAKDELRRFYLKGNPYVSRV